MRRSDLARSPPSSIAAARQIWGRTSGLAHLKTVVYGTPFEPSFLSNASLIEVGKLNFS